MRIFLDNMLVMAQMLKEISQEKETLIFLLQKLSFMINLKNSSNTSEGNRVFDDINLSSGKSFGYPKQMHTTDTITKYHNYGINQTPRKTLVHCSGSVYRKNSVQVPEKQQI